MSRRVKLTVAYDGTDYCGWQIQPNGITVEEVLNKKISKLTGEDIRIIGASRTDSGVHAPVSYTHLTLPTTPYVRGYPDYRSKPYRFRCACTGKCCRF